MTTEPDTTHSSRPDYRPQWHALLGAVTIGLGIVFASLLMLDSSTPARAEFRQDHVAATPSGLVGLNDGSTAPAEHTNVSAGNAVTFTLAWSALENDHTSSIAWGDWDSDGDLDLAVGNVGEPIRVYANIGEELELAWSSSEIARTSSVAWGDWDNDGDLDLAVGNTDEPNRVYRNTGGALIEAWHASHAQNTQSVAWGDFDDDGDLDLAVGNTGQANRVYRNIGGSMTLAWEAAEAMTTTSVAWGDLDQNGTLDLAVANDGRPLQVYTNTRTSLLLAWTDLLTETQSVAWGDCNGDGDLDLATGSLHRWNRVYENMTGTLTLAWEEGGWALTESVAWGDWDDDGDLDLVQGNGASIDVLKNTNNTCSFTLETLSAEPASASSVAWGDWDADGDLDLAVGSLHSSPSIPRNRVYENAGGRLRLAWNQSEVDNTRSIAWGDWNRDALIDLAVANEDGPSRVYTSTGSLLRLAWSAPVSLKSRSVAWGDWDGDGDLDLAVGNHNVPDQVYTTTITSAGGVFGPPWRSPQEAHTDSLAWADKDGDGDLDLAVGSPELPNQVYVNLGGELRSDLLDPQGYWTRSVAWGDWDADGDLDLAVGNYNEFVRVYANMGSSFKLAWTSPITQPTESVAWADWDRDSDLDLAVGNCCIASRVYENTGGNLQHVWSSPETDHAVSMAWADWDNDGDLDLAVGNDGSGTRVYVNSRGTLKRSWSTSDGAETRSVAWGDWDNDGDLDLAIGNGGKSSQVYSNKAADNPHLADSSSTAFIPYPGDTVVMFYGSTTILNGPTTPISYTLKDAEGDPVRLVKAYYSLDGGSTWQPAIAASGTITRNLAASPQGIEHVFNWNIYASKVFGASDNAVFRLDVYQGYSSAGPYQYAYRTARSLPFRLRGSQVRVMKGAEPAAEALVYRLPAGQTGAFEPYRDGLSRPFRTNPAGYLQGYGELTLGDRFAALAPITATESYTLYFTNAQATASGIDPAIVSVLGVQTLTVSSSNPLVLFNLDVSLEWDARNDAPFLTQLNQDLRRASELLYDWSNGQAALGKVTVYHAKQHWQDAHVLIYANNRFRPAATEGGIITGTLTETVSISSTSVITYLPGQVAMGPVWNRYGDPGSNLGEDWPRAFAHELAHFALFLDDNYVGLDDQGLLMPVDTCPGAMADPYRDDDASGYGEFHPAAAWLPGCANTLSNRNTGRADWTTVGVFYPWLTTAITNANPGPSVLPLAVTEVQVVEPITPTTALQAPLFLLVQNGNRVIPDSRARSYLFQDGWAIDLGQPSQDRLLARGAKLGDRLCVYDLGSSRLGCETITPGDTELELVDQPVWQPEVTVTPITTRSLAISVTHAPASLVMHGKLYPLGKPSQGDISLVEVNGEYLGTFELDTPSLVGVIQVWVDEPGQRREIVSDYVLGGNPGRIWSGGGRIWSGGGRIWSGGGRIWSGGAPVGSADGQVMVYNPDDSYSQEWFLTVQSSSVTPPLWATLVGKAYRVSASGAVPNLNSMSIAFSYLGSDVPPGEESWLRVYHWNGATWEQQPTRLDTTNNMASARVMAEGVYALMSSIEIPLYGPGWDLFGYPILDTRPVTDALISISGYYTTVHGYNPAQPDPFASWHTYDLDMPSQLQTLDALKFGEGYWINVSQSITLFLKGSAQGLEAAPDFQFPPATYFGPVVAGNGFTPTVGMPVTAWIDGHLCGRSAVQDVDGQLMVAVNVLAESPGVAAGCGQPGRPIVFQVGSTTMALSPLWDNNRTLRMAFTTLDQATLRMVSGWNLVALPLDPATPYTAQSLMDAINGQGGQCSEVNRWLNGGWDAHINGLSFNNFVIEQGKGYFVKCTAKRSWIAVGQAVTAGVPLALVSGWNLVSLPYPPVGYTAQSLLDSIANQGGACSEVDRWLYGGWDAHIGGLPLNYFAIEPGRGYFVKCSQASTFRPA